VPRSYIEPWPWFWSVARADRIEQIDHAWPRLALARRELLTLCWTTDQSDQLRRLTAAVSRSEMLGQARRDQLLEILAEAYSQLRPHRDRYPP
jgi:hypothetical protein